MLEQLLDWLIEEDILKGSGEIAKKASLGEWDSQMSTLTIVNGRCRALERSRRGRWVMAI